MDYERRGAHRPEVAEGDVAVAEAGLDADGGDAAHLGEGHAHCL